MTIMSNSSAKRQTRSALFPRRTKSGEIHGTPASSSSSPVLPRQPESQPIWIDLIQTGVEWLGCDSTNPLDAVTTAACTSTQPRTAATNDTSDNSSADESTLVAKLHEDFLDALLQEQVHLASSSSKITTSRSRTPTNASYMSPQRQDSFNTDASFGSLSVSTDGGSLRSQYSSFSTATGSRSRKEKRRLGRPYQSATHTTSDNSVNNGSSSIGGTSSISTKTVASDNSYSHGMNAIEKYERKYADQTDSTNPPPRLPLDTIRERGTFPLPHEFIHEDCVLQKDRGKGEPLGSAIKATDKDSCVMKLREKMEVVGQLSKDSKATWKRRPAITTKITSEYIETRSMMELRLGFLSMQYGLLLRWQRPTSESPESQHRIVAMILRKMCHDSFYKVKKSSAQHHHLSEQQHHNAKYQPQHPTKGRHHRSSSATTVAAMKARKLRKQPQLVPFLRPTTSMSKMSSTAYCHDAIWEGRRSKEHGGRDAEVLWLEPVADVQPSTLHVKLANFMMEPSLMAARRNTVLDRTTWSLSLALDGTPPQLIRWTNKAPDPPCLPENTSMKSSIDEAHDGKAPKVISDVQELSNMTMHFTGLKKPCDLELRLLKQTPSDKLPTIVAMRTLPLVEWMSQPHPHPSRESRLRMTLGSSLLLTLHLTYESEQALQWYQTFEQLHLYDDYDLDRIPDLDSLSSSSQNSEQGSFFDWFCGFCSRDCSVFC